MKPKHLFTAAIVLAVATPIALVASFAIDSDMRYTLQLGAFVALALSSVLVHVAIRRDRAALTAAGRTAAAKPATRRTTPTS